MYAITSLILLYFTLFSQCFYRVYSNCTLINLDIIRILQLYTRLSLHFQNSYYPFLTNSLVFPFFEKNYVMYIFAHYGKYRIFKALFLYISHCRIFGTEFFTFCDKALFNRFRTFLFKTSSVGYSKNVLSLYSLAAALATLLTTVTVVTLVKSLI